MFDYMSCESILGFSLDLTLLILWIALLLRVVSVLCVKNLLASLFSGKELRFPEELIFVGLRGDRCAVCRPIVDGLDVCELQN